MHEALLSRGKVSNSRFSPGIMSACNCVLPCTECHSELQGVGGDKHFEICARHLVKREGFTKILAWLVWAEATFEAGAEALNRFRKIDFQLGE